jgi:16S rRNA U1498 N3-methylase RsmE
VLATAQGDELVLFDTRGERYFTLNEVGSRIWALLAEETSPDEIVDQLRTEYAMPAGVSGDPIVQDVTRLLEELRSAHLLSVERMHHGS